MGNKMLFFTLTTINLHLSKYTFRHKGKIELKLLLTILSVVPGHCLSPDLDASATGSVVPWFVFAGPQWRLDGVRRDNGWGRPETLLRLTEFQQKFREARVLLLQDTVVFIFNFPFFSGLVWCVTVGRCKTRQKSFVKKSTNHNA